jgi:hypothetical protein
MGDSRRQEARGPTERGAAHGPSLLFLNAAGRAEDSGVARPYEFAHALHRHMIYEQIPDRRRQRRLDGHLKSGHRGTGQNRPKGRAPKPLVL